MFFFASEGIHDQTKVFRDYNARSERALFLLSLTAFLLIHFSFSEKLPIMYLTAEDLVLFEYDRLKKETTELQTVFDVEISVKFKWFDRHFRVIIQNVLQVNSTVRVQVVYTFALFVRGIICQHAMKK